VERKTLLLPKRARSARCSRPPPGDARQDAQAQSDSPPTSQGEEPGIHRSNALVTTPHYHHVGSGAVKKYGVKAARSRAGYDKITLKTLYQAALV
jgi:hypothetical protein